MQAGCLQVACADGPREILGADSGKGGGADPMASDHGPFRTVTDDLLDAVRDERAPVVTGRSVRAVYAVIEAIIASPRQDATVLLAADIA